MNKEMAPEKRNWCFLNSSLSLRVVFFSLTFNPSCKWCLVNNSYHADIWEYYFPSRETLPSLHTCLGNLNLDGRVPQMQVAGYCSKGMPWELSHKQLGGWKLNSLTPNYSTACHLFSLYSAHDDWWVSDGMVVRHPLYILEAVSQHSPDSTSTCTISC